MIFDAMLAGKRSDIYSWDLIQSVPEPRSLESPSAAGFFFGLCFCAAVFLISATVKPCHHYGPAAEGPTRR